MGLTIHYTLATREPLTSTEARKLVARARLFARERGVESISRLIRVEPDFPLAHEWVALPQSSGGATHVDVPPETGHVFTVVPGRDCESLLLGLCRYPAFATYRGQELPTNAGEGWRLRGSCKTQYASLHGWEQFLRSHRTAIELVNFWRTLGVQVRITDEGGYWPRRSEKVLRQSLDELNGIVAAMGGALKDDAGGLSVVSPMFRHPQFERLEAEGAAQHRGKVRQAAEVIEKVAHGRAGRRPPRGT